MAVGLMPDCRRGQELAGPFEVWARAVLIALREQVVRSVELGLDVAEEVFGAGPDVMGSGAGAEHEDAGERGRVTLKHGSMR
jgi:hypothetical protein